MSSSARSLLLASLVLLSLGCSTDDDGSCANGSCAGAGGQAGSSGNDGGSSGAPHEGCGDCATEACCDGQCVDLTTSVEHCGQCGTHCSGGDAGWSCQAGVCTIDQCNTGSFDCDHDASNGCETSGLRGPTTPVLRTPMNGAYTGSVHAERSLRPTFTWQSSDPLESCLGSFMYQIQIDDSCERSTYASCEFPSPEVDQIRIRATSFSPASPLPVRTGVPVGTRYYWRVRACGDPEHCSEWTPTRYLNVGRLMNDLNGDGYSDTIAVSRYEGGGTYSYYYPQIMEGGAAGNYRLGPAFSSAISDLQIGQVKFVGDVNGDGFADALHTAGFSQGMYLGARDVTTIAPTPLPRFQAWMEGTALGDWNGDGYDDFVVGHFYDLEPMVASVKVYQGGAELDDVPDLELAPPGWSTEERFGVSVAGAVDMDGDGYSELAVLDSTEGVVEVVRGGVAPNPNARTLLRLTETCHQGFVARAGDLNGDGLGELAVRCGKRLSVFAGRPVLAVVPVWTTELIGSYMDRGGDIIAGFDLGNDGIDDLLFHDKVELNNDIERRLLVLPGATTLAADSPTYPILPKLSGQFAFVSTGLSAGDVDGDGRADIMVAGWGPDLLYVYSGAAAAENAASCAQPSASFPQVGNWCDLTGAELDPGDVVHFGEVMAY